MGGDVVADEPFPRAALAEADEPLLAARPSVGGGQKRRQNKEPTDCADGPLVAVAVVGQSEHRWGNMFRSVAGQGALRLVEDRLQEIGLSVDRACGGPASIVGMCVMRSWSFAGTPGVEERHMAAMLMKEVRLQTAHVGVLRFPILAAARLLDPVAIDLVDVGDITRAEARLHVRTLCSDYSAGERVPTAPPNLGGVRWGPLRPRPPPSCGGDRQRQVGLAAPGCASRCGGAFAAASPHGA